MSIDRDEFTVLLTRANLTYAQLGKKIGRSERTVSTWGSQQHGGVPDKYEAVVRDALAIPGTAGNPLAAYSNYALLDELARRLRLSHSSPADSHEAATIPEETDTVNSEAGTNAVHKRGRIKGRGPRIT